MKQLLILLFLSITALLTACGQTGPLYLPGTKPPIYVPPPHVNGKKIQIPGQTPGQ